MGNRKVSNEPAPSRSRRPSRSGNDLARGASRETTVPTEALVSPRHEQHTRKGQAQSPRELTHNEPPKKKR
jgi:hypothetical protein